MDEFFEIVANVSVLVFVVACMATAGLGLRVREIVGPLRRARLVAFALVANFVIAPAIAYALTQVFALEPPYAIGLLSMLPFIVIPAGLTDEAIQGPLASYLGGADVSAFVGLIVSAAVYFLLTRSLDLAAEQPAIEASERTIAATMP